MHLQVESQFWVCECDRPGPRSMLGHFYLNIRNHESRFSPSAVWLLNLNCCIQFLNEFESRFHSNQNWPNITAHEEVMMWNIAVCALICLGWVHQKGREGKGSCKIHLQFPIFAADLDIEGFLENGVGTRAILPPPSPHPAPCAAPEWSVVGRSSEGKERGEKERSNFTCKQREWCDLGGAERPGSFQEGDTGADRSSPEKCQSCFRLDFSTDHTSAVWGPLLRLRNGDWAKWREKGELWRYWDKRD